MDEKRSGGTRGFYHLAESWYAGHLQEEPKPGMPLDDVMFGVYHPHGGTYGEMRMEWVALDEFRTATPRLCVFGDAFKILPTFADVWAELVTSPNPTPEQFCDLLKRLGFEDLTQRKGPRD